jgi:protein-disulfide isomerase
MSKQNKTILIIAVILIAVGLVLMARGNQTLSNSGTTVRPIDSTDHVWGDLKAPVQMIVYSDFECPFCAKFAQTVKVIEENFKDKVAITFRHYPSAGHLEAETAAEVSECAAEQGKFWEMHDKLFADNVAGRMGLEQFKQDATDLGLNQNQFNQCLDNGQYAAKVSTQKAEGKKAGVTGTPTSFINGNIYPGAYPFEDFTAPDGRPEKGMKSIISELLK